MKLVRKQRDRERDYSHRPLLDKLGVKEFSTVSVVNFSDKAFWGQLRRQTPAVSIGKPKKDSDLIFYEANSLTELRKLRSLIRFMNIHGAIWVLSLKGALARIRDVDVITAAKKAGLVDNKVVGFSETHTSLRLVIPKEKRI